MKSKIIIEIDGDDDVDINLSIEVAPKASKDHRKYVGDLLKVVDEQIRESTY